MYSIHYKHLRNVYLHIFTMHVAYTYVHKCILKCVNICDLYSQVWKLCMWTKQFLSEFTYMYEISGKYIYIFSPIFHLYVGRHVVDSLKVAV